jgi:26S proteasome regulatory subunit N2
LRELNELFQLTARGAEERAAELGGAGSGAAAAAGVLTAVDEDNEGDEEAPAPADFEYFTDAEDDEN